MKVRKEWTIIDPTTIKIDKSTKGFMDYYKNDGETYDRLLKRIFRH
jgi:hypothetical protein